MLRDRIDLYRQIETERQSKLLVYITGDKPGMETQISEEVHDHFVNHLDKFNLPNKITLYLYTRGGNTMAAWALINLLKQFCNEYEVIVPSKARSAGTLICLGANNIIMTKQATLGPIDPTLNSHINPQNPSFPQNPQARVPISVESIKGYFDYAKTDLNIHSETELAQIFTSISQQIHPVVIGNAFRSRAQIQMMAKTLLTQHFPGELDKIQNIINFLCSDSGSHDYPIFRREGRNNLGLNIETPSADLYTKIKSIYDSLAVELELNTAFEQNAILGVANQATFTVRRSIIESIDGGTDVFVTEGTLTKSQVPMQIGPGTQPIMRTAIENSTNFEGWRHETTNP